MVVLPKITCLFKHLFAWRPHYLAAFNLSCLNAISRAVCASEARHSAQICVIAEHTLPWSYLRRNAPVRQRAQMLFGKHRVWDTEAHTGVLIYINFVERSVELVADRALSRSVPQAQWDEWAAALQKAYAAKQFEAGTVRVIQSMGLIFERVAPKIGEQPTENTLADDPLRL